MEMTVKGTDCSVDGIGAFRFSPEPGVGVALHHPGARSTSGSAVGEHMTRHIPAWSLSPQPMPTFARSVVAEREHQRHDVVHATATLQTRRPMALERAAVGGAANTIAVGCVVVSEDAISPGFHVADIC